MKITSIKPIIVGTGGGNWVFCKVETDMASVHLDLCTPNCLIQEHPRGGCPWRYDLWEGEVEVENGYALPPTKPGWELELNEKEAAKHPYEPVNRGQYRFPDGSVSDI